MQFVHYLRWFALLAGACNPQSLHVALFLVTIVCRSGDIALWPGPRFILTFERTPGKELDPH